MSTIESLALSGPHLSALETGAQFAARVGARVSSGYGPLSVPCELAPLFPARGLERGFVYGISGGASLSLLSALASSATQSGSWLALVNMPHVGLRSMHEYGVALHRTVCVSTPEKGSVWSGVVGALVDGIDLVAVSATHCSASEARRIAARVKAQGSVLFVMNPTQAFSLDAVLSASTHEWEFSTHAAQRSVQVSAHGRRVYGQRSCSVFLPNRSGGVSTGKA
ncbi:MAG: hypothetical protein ACO3JF_07765 [Ilumatobacteraceae bacterium]